MKEFFSGHKFTEDALSIIATAESICDSFEAQGLDLSLRHLYYQMIIVNTFPNTEASYKRLRSIISDARIAGLIDWDMIKDRTRDTSSNTHFDSPHAFLQVVPHWFRIDTWEGQDNHVEVMVDAVYAETLERQWALKTEISDFVKTFGRTA